MIRDLILIALLSFTVNAQIALTDEIDAGLREICEKEIEQMNKRNYDAAQTLRDERGSRCDYKVFSVPDKFLADKKNRFPEFVGYSRLHYDLFMKEGHGYGSLKKFRQWAEAEEWNEFGPNNHFDWWMFPISDESSHGYGYTVFGKDISYLKKDPIFMKDYKEGVAWMFKSWGWSVHHKRLFKKLHPDQKWRKYDVRLRKVIQSLALFGEKRYLSSAVSFAEHLRRADPDLVRGQITNLLVNIGVWEREEFSSQRY